MHRANALTWEKGNRKKCCTREKEGENANWTREDEDRLIKEKNVAVIYWHGIEKPTLEGKIETDMGKKIRDIYWPEKESKKCRLSMSKELQIKIWKSKQLTHWYGSGKRYTLAWIREGEANWQRKENRELILTCGKWRSRKHCGRMIRRHKGKAE